jgi:hypothetical protein
MRRPLVAHISDPCSVSRVQSGETRNVVFLILGQEFVDLRQEMANIFSAFVDMIVGSAVLVE